MNNLIPRRNGLSPWRDDIFSGFEHKMNQMLDKMFGEDFFSGIKDSGFPIADAYTADGKLHIEFPVPQVDADNMEVSEKDGILTVKGFVEKRREDATHHLKEWKRGAFSRQFRLPENVVGDPEATLKNGTLLVTYMLEQPPPKEEVSKRIEVKKG